MSGLTLFFDKAFVLVLSNSKEEEEEGESIVANDTMRRLETKGVKNTYANRSIFFTAAVEHYCQNLTRKKIVKLKLVMSSVEQRRGCNNY